MYREIKYLIHNEIILEWRQKYALGGIFIYVLSTIFVSYLSFKQIIDIPTWNALFWIILLFASINAVAKSFIRESGGKQLYMYTLASPQSIILSKIIYNSLLMMMLSALCLLFYILFIGNPVQDMFMFSIALLLGSLGFASTFTLISAIASKAGNNLTLMAILGFPIILPLLITLITLSKNAIDGLAWSVNYKYILVLLLLNLIVVSLSFLLFPYLWRDS